MKKHILIAVFSLCLLSPVQAQDDFDEVTINTIHVRGNIYMLEGQGGNIGASVGEDGILVIDDQFAPLSDKIIAALKEIKDVPIKFVINTHWHSDHTGGNEEFGEFATLIAHDNVRKRLSEGQFMEFFQKEVKPAPEGALPVITFAKSLSVHFNGEEIKVLHFPKGHTDGDSVIFFTESNVVHTGDHLFNERFPFIDLESGGSVQGFAANVKEILDSIDEDTKLIPGHGELATKKDMERDYEMLAKTTRIVHTGITEGRSLEEIIAAGLGDEWEEYGNGFIDEEAWIRIVYKSLTENQEK